MVKTRVVVDIRVRKGFDLKDMWQDPKAPMELRDNEVQVWRLDVERPDGSVQEKHTLLRQCYAVLNTEERERAGRMRAGMAREEFVVARGALRRLLGATVDADPRTLALASGAHGKPHLLRGGPAFNVAHSRGVVLIALTRASSVGVDVEYMDAAVELSEVARDAFAPADVARLDRLRTHEDRLREFFRCWTRREAVAKADGRGLTMEPSPIGNETEGEVEIAGHYVRGVELGGCHVGAVANVRAGMLMRLYRMPAGSPLLFAE